MRELLERMKRDREAIRDKEAKRSEQGGELEYAQALRSCELFRGDESIEELAALLFSPRGIEFCIAYDFPSIGVLRRFKPFHPERFGIYIDSGEIALNDAERVCLIGNTTARLNYRQAQGNRLYLLYGARAEVTAKGYAVVRVEKDRKAELNWHCEDFAKVLL